MPTGVLEDVEVLGLYEAIRMAEYDPVLCLLGLRRSQKIDWSRYGGDNSPCFSYDFKTGQLFDVPPLRAKKRSKKGSGGVFDIPGHNVQCLQKIQFASIKSYKSEWLEFDGAPGLVGGPEVVFVDLSVLDDLELLFERDARRTRDVVTAKPKLQKKWGLLRDGLPGL